MNLLVGRRKCQKGLKGGSDEHSLWMHDNSGSQVLKARQHGGVYVLAEIVKDLNEFAVIAAMKNKADTTFPARSDHSNDHTDDQTNSTGTNNSSSKYARLYRESPCEVCSLTKICNKRNHHFSERTRLGDDLRAAGAMATTVAKKSCKDLNN